MTTHVDAGLLHRVRDRKPTLTDAEREAVAWAEDCADSQREWKIGATLRGLLERLGVEQTDNRPEP